MTNIVEEYGNKVQELCELPDKVKDFIHQAENNWLVKLLHLASLVREGGEKLLSELNKAIDIAKAELKGVDLYKDLKPLMSTWDQVHLTLNEVNETLSGRDMSTVNEYWEGKGSTAYQNVLTEYAKNTDKLGSTSLDAKKQLEAMKNALEILFAGLVAFVVAMISAIVSIIVAGVTAETIVGAIAGMVVAIISGIGGLVALGTTFLAFSQSQSSATESLADDVKDSPIFNKGWEDANVGKFSDAGSWSAE